MPDEPSMLDGESVWSCPSDSGNTPHTVDLEGRNGRGICNCPDFTFRSHKKGYSECRHIRRVFRAFAELKLKQLMRERGTLNQRSDGP